MSSNAHHQHLETPIFGLIHNLLDTQTVSGMPGFKKSMSAALEELEAMLLPFGKGEEAITACVEYVFNGGVEIIPSYDMALGEEVPVLLSAERPFKFDAVFLRNVAIEYLRKHSDWGNRLSLKELPGGVQQYACPWALWKGEDGNPKLHPGYTLRSSPDPVFCMKVRKRNGGYCVNVPPDFDWEWRQWRGIPEPDWLPLIEAVTPEVIPA